MEMMEVLVKVLMLAEQAGAREIGTDHLLAAIDQRPTEGLPVASPSELLVPIEKRDMPFSIEAMAALESVGGLERSDVEELRNTLIAIKRE